MSGSRRDLTVWAAPAAWAVLALVSVRVGRTGLEVAACSALLAAVGPGLCRALATNRGGIAGRVAELLLAGGGIAWLLADAPWQRDLLALAVPAAAGALGVAAVWPSAPPVVRRRIAGVVGLGVGLLLLPGLEGAPWWGAKAAAVALAAGLTGRLLAETMAPALAAATVAAVGAALGPGHTAAWLLPPLVAAIRVLLGRRQPLVAAVLSVAAAAVPPAGLALAAGSIAAAAVTARRAALLAALAPAAALAWWRLPHGVTLLHAPAWEPLQAALPLAPTALPLLLPAAVLGLAAAGTAPLVGLAVALASLTVVGGGPWSAAAAAAAWLLVLPSGRRVDAAAAATLPWTCGAAAALLLLAPWDAAALVAVRPAPLLVAWTVALALSLLGRRAARLAWVLPLAGLAWTVPVEGIDRSLAAGERLELPAPAGGGWALLAAHTGSTPAADGASLVAVGGLAPLRAGHDLPTVSGSTRHTITMVAGRGREAGGHRRGLAVRRVAQPLTVEAAVPVVIRTEDLAAWENRRRRLTGLLGGALVLLALAHLAGSRGRDGPLALGTGLVIAAGVAAGCGVEPLALTAHRGVADLALAVAACAAWSALPAFGRRRFFAGAALLVPLALAQPLLRHPAGDEVYHLELLQSLAQDHDLAPANNFDPAEPSEAVYLAHGDTLIHSPGLALALLPGYLAGGHPGALVLIALMVAGGAALAARRAEAIGLGRRPSTLAWALVAASYPAVTFASQIWPAAAGVLLVGLGLEAAARGRVVAAAAAAAVAVVVKVRLGLVTLPLAAAAALRGRGRGLLLAGGALAAAALAVAAVFGGPLGRNRLAQLLPDDALQSARVVWGLAWDAAGGLAFSAPLWLLAVAAMPLVWRRAGAGERALVLGGAATVVALFDHPDWFGGGSPPARYLVPLLPLALLGIAAALGRTAGRRAVGLLVGPSAILAWVAVTRPLALYHGGDPGWWFADGLSRALDGAGRNLFPSLLRPNLATVLVPAALVAACWWWARRPRRVAAAAMVLAVALTAAWTAGGREWRVEAEDPQVRAFGGAVEPPIGTMGRAGRILGWRLEPGSALELPWRPPLGAELAAVVRVADRDPEARLQASWDGGPARPLEVTAAEWSQVALPPPPGLGRSVLRLAWTSPGGSVLHLDRVEAR